MLKLTLFLAAAVCVTLADVNDVAMVFLSDPEGKSGVVGYLTLTQVDDGITIRGNVTGLNKNGTHGFHVHEFGDVSGGCATTGSHFNPEKKSHGGPSDDERHVGDLGNIQSDDVGVADISILDKVISFYGTNGILGRAIVVHADPDDLGKGNETDSATTGHAGARLACGIIGVKSITPHSGAWSNTPLTFAIIGFIFLLMKF